MLAFRIRRPAAASVLMAAIVFAGLLPPAHIHLAAEHDDHHLGLSAIEHSHWAPHQFSGTAFDDGDGRVLFVDHPARLRATDGRIAAPHAAAIAMLAQVTAPVVHIRGHRASGNAPRDGPLRDSLLNRGPPLVP